MGNVKELFAPDNLKKNIEYSVTHHDLNLKLISEQEKKESKRFEKNVNNLKKLQQ